MAKDDYDTLVCKILVYLYKKLKGKAREKQEDYIAPLTDDFPVSEEYMNYILFHMKDEGLIEDIGIIKAWGGTVIVTDLTEVKISPKGITYLRDNSVMRKIAGTLPAASSIMSLFI